MIEVDTFYTAGRSLAWLAVPYSVSPIIVSRALRHHGVGAVRVRVGREGLRLRVSTAAMTVADCVQNVGANCCGRGPGPVSSSWWLSGRPGPETHAVIARAKLIDFQSPGPEIGVHLPSV